MKEETTKGGSTDCKCLFDEDGKGTKDVNCNVAYHITFRILCRSNGVKEASNDVFPFLFDFMMMLGSAIRDCKRVSMALVRLTWSSTALCRGATTAPCPTIWVQIRRLIIFQRHKHHWGSKEVLCRVTRTVVEILSKASFKFLLSGFSRIYFNLCSRSVSPTLVLGHILDVHCCPFEPYIINVEDLLKIARNAAEIAMSSVEPVRKPSIVG